MMLTPSVKQLIDLALEEDLGRGDVTSEAIFAVEDECRGKIIAKQELVVAGVEIARRVFHKVDKRCAFEAVVADGARLAPGEPLALVSGPTRGVLGAERTALNFLQRLSGIATLTARFVEEIRGTRAVVCDTRKTTPGWRALDKRAVRAGGGANHRADLASGVLIKDNHVAACGGVRAAVERARAHAPHTLRVEVEVTRLDQIEEAIPARAEVILFDNFTPELVRQGVALVAGARGDRSLGRHQA